MSDALPQVIVNREQALAFFDDRIDSGVEPGLVRISGLLEYMGNPHRDYPSIHIAGTNGKSTVTRMVQQILGAHGLSVGGFTSPHLHRVEERFGLHGTAISGDSFVAAVSDIAWFVAGYEREHATTVTYFEVAAALAFALFSTATVDVGVIEVGLGGRLDATNVVIADVSVVTGIGIDHTEFLGETIALIATEKAAIVKDGGTLVTGDLPSEAIAAVSARVDETKANWIKFDSDFFVSEANIAVGGWQCSVTGVHGEYEDLVLRIHGRHQVDNLATAIATCEMFLGRELDNESLAKAVGSMTSPGRLEVVRRRPVVLIDGAHNEQGFEGLAATIDNEFPALQWNLVLGARGNRSIGDLVMPLKGHIRSVFATAPHGADAIDANDVATAAGEALGVPAVAYESPELALADAVSAAGSDGGVIVAGSLYLVGDVRESFDIRPDRSAEAHLRFEAEVADDNDDDDFADSDLFD
ncbi:MAG: Mur ligase family protein [Actinomycetota bacterium]|nr:Mur ligase family protein [Actinomycetota bacterium]